MVLVMCIRVVRVTVPERGMVVRMAVWFIAIPRKIVFVLVVYIMRMGVRVRHRRMKVVVRMLFCQVQPYAYGHECTGHQQRQRYRFAHKQRQHSAEEGGYQK